MELLKGWFKAMLIIVPIVIAMGWSSENKHYVIYFILLLAFYVLFSAGIYLAMRYRLSRTRWRGIRFGLGGSAVQYMILSIKRFALNVVTLGYLIPHSDIAKWTYMANHMTFGKTGFSYKGSAGNLVWINLITLWAPALLYIAVIVLLVLTIPAGDLKQNSAVSAHMLGFIFAFYGVAFAAFLGRQWYRAALRAERLRGLKLDGLRFKSTATGAGYFRLKLGNVLIIVFTLGLGFAIVTNRNMKFECKTILVGGDLDQLVASQADPSKKSDVGDVLAPDLDMGSALSIGI
jgi:uncharacterized membrane protein YjgN (DUF898 family)